MFADSYQSEKDTEVVRFFAISDFGRKCEAIEKLAAAMEQFVIDYNFAVDFILGLGDIFYPRGPPTADHPMFEEVWRAQFIDPHPALRVPWRMHFGNHDYFLNPHALIDYHSHSNNRDQLWFLPNYTYRVTERRKHSGIQPDESSANTAEAAETYLVDFFSMDTNGCDQEIQYIDEDSIPSLHCQIAQLKEKLHLSKARWKIVCGHHPMYTNGVAHSRAAKRLRECTEYEYCKYGWRNQIQMLPGFGLEDILCTENVDAYFAGHEHVFQSHYALGVHHFCCGATGADVRPGTGLHKGLNTEIQLDWVGKAEEIGFVAVELSYNKMVTRFIDINGVLLREVVSDKL